MTGYSNYPNKIDTSIQLPQATDNITPVKAEVVNRLRDAVLSIENELGVDPSREFGTVRARLDALSSGGGGSGSVQILQNGAQVIQSASTLDFTGNVGVTVTQPFSVQIDVIGGQTIQVQEFFNVSPGQTSFTLTRIPIQSTAVMMFINGVKQLFGNDYSVSNNIVSYFGTTLLLATDKVEFWYMVDVSGIPQVGPAGPAGAQGISAFTTVAANFTQPAVSSTVIVTVVQSSWMVAGEVLFIANGGYYLIASVPDTTHVVVQNLGYPGNSSPGSTITIGKGITPGGIAGPASGSAGGDLTGTYPNPTVAKLQNIPVSIATPTTSQVLQYNGSQWAPTSFVGGTGSRPTSDANTILDYRFNETTLGVLRNYGSYGTASCPIGPAPTTTTANFTQVAVGSTVTISVVSTTGYSVNALITVGALGTFGSGGNYYVITAIGGSTSMTIRSVLGVTGGGYTSPGSTIPSGSVVAVNNDLLNQGGGGTPNQIEIANLGPYDYCQYFPKSAYSNWNNGAIYTVQGAPDFVGLTKISMHVLANPGSPIAAQWQFWFGYSWAQSWSPTFSTLGCTIGVPNTGNGNWGLIGANQSWTVTSSNASQDGWITPGNWQLLSVTIDLTTTTNAVKFYKNGRACGTSNISATGALAMGTGGYWFIANPNATLGDTGDATYGQLAMVRFENVVRSQSYIQNMWNTIYPATSNWPVP